MGLKTEGGAAPEVAFYNPFQYVADTWLAYRHHGVLPERGALNDQDPTLVADWNTMNARYNYVAGHLQDNDTPPVPNAADDWTNL